MTNEQFIEGIKEISSTCKDIMKVSYSQISEGRKENIKRIKELGNVFYSILDTMEQSREISLAKTKLEECVMWAVKGISA